MKKLGKSFETQTGRISNNMKEFLNKTFLITLERKLNEHPIHASQNLSILFLASKLPDLGLYCHWKPLNLRSI